MRIGVPSEIKEGERRVGLTPGCVRELVADGHAVAIQAGAGKAAGFADSEFRDEGASILATAEEVYDFGKLIVKVKEPQANEVALLTSQHILFTYLHLAANTKLALALADTGATCIAYETVEDERGALPLLAPMSEIAGRIAALLGVDLLLAPRGGAGILLGGVPGAPAGRVVIIGGGVAGEQAASVVVGLCAQVTVLDRSLPRIRELDTRFQGRVVTAFSTDHAIEEALAGANLVIGAVLIPGDNAPRVIRREHLALLAPGAVLVDVAIDQGGCAETSHPTTHAEPSYEVDGVRHAAVTNLPAAAPITATRALTNATLPFVSRLAALDGADAALADPALQGGVNVARGEIVHPAVARNAGSPRPRKLSYSLPATS
jgi:alanine dehydrogenase